MPEIKRPIYFTSQFLIDKDFSDEQSYHRQMRLLHNRQLHSFGVADGLQVTRNAPNEVRVSQGTAIDALGREIVLQDARTYTLVSGGNGADIYLTIAYQEALDVADHYPPGTADEFTRTTERPLLADSSAVAPTDGSVILLARIHLNSDGKIESDGSIDMSLRPTVSAKLADGAVTLAKIAPAVRPIVSVDGVKNPGGNVDLVAANSITIAPNDTNKTITIGDSHSGRTDNPHATTAVQVGALPSVGGSLSGSVSFNTAPTSPQTALNVSRTDAAMTSGTKELTRISMFGSGTSNLQGTMTFSTANGGAGSAPVERMRIHANGNIGIGSANPGVQFSVGGDGVPVYGTGMWIEYNLHVQGIETLVQGGRGRLRVGNAWGYAGLYADATSTGAGNDLVLGASSATVRIGAEGSGQNLRVCGSLSTAGNAAINGSFLTVTGSANEQAYIGGDGGGADVNVGSFNAGIITLGCWNFGGNFPMNVIGAKFTVFSDRRLKDNIEPIADALQKVRKLRGVSFDWIHSKEKNGRQIGLIAQEVAKVAPEAVSQHSKGMYCMDYSALVSVLIEAVKELDAKVTKLEAEKRTRSGTKH